MSLVTVNSRNDYKFERPYIAKQLQRIVAGIMTIPQCEAFSLTPADIRVKLLRRDPDEFGFPSVTIDIVADRYDQLARALPERRTCLVEAIEASKLFPAAHHGAGEIEVWIQLIDGIRGTYHP